MLQRYTCSPDFRNSQLFFFYKNTAPTEIYTLPLHDALPIYVADDQVARPAVEREAPRVAQSPRPDLGRAPAELERIPVRDRKSTRLNSSHANISYAVFCLKKKKTSQDHLTHYCFSQLLILLT